MPPDLALLLCIAFILFILRIDPRRNAGFSSALWIPLIWVLIVASRSPFLWLNPGALLEAETVDAIHEGNPIDRIVFSALIVAGLLILWRRKTRWSRISRGSAPVFFYFAYCVISIAWSDSPLISFKRWVKDIGNLVMVLVVLTDPAPLEAVKALFRRCAYVLIPLSIVLIKYYPKLGRSYSRWTGQANYGGVTTGKNALGMLCLVCGLFFLWNVLVLATSRAKKQSVDKTELFVSVGFLIMISWLLGMANSATSLACLIVGILALVLTASRTMKRKPKYAGIALFLSILFFLAVQLGLNLAGIIVSGLGRDMTFTGRIDLWRDVISAGANPLLGTGYGSFWLGDRLRELWATFPWHPKQAHNGYLEVYLNLGLVGLLSIVGVVICAWRNIGKQSVFDFEFARLEMTFLIVVLLYNLMEATFGGLSLLWFVLLIVAGESPAPIAVPDSGREQYHTS